MIAQVLVSPLLLLLIARVCNANHNDSTNDSTNKSNNARCLRKLLRNVGCVAGIMHETPVDRFTCQGLQDLWNCETLEIERYCSGAHAGTLKEYAREKMKIMFPGGRDCHIFRSPSSFSAKLFSSSEPHLCSPVELYKSFIGVNTCGHLLPAVRPDINNGDPCGAVDMFIEDCFTKSMERCYPSSSGPFKISRLQAVAQFLKSLATFSANETLNLVKPCKDVKDSSSSNINNNNNNDDFFHESGLDHMYGTIRGLGSTRSTSEFKDVPNERYFSLDVTSDLVEEAILSAPFPDYVLKAAGDRTTIGKIMRMSAEQILLLRKRK